MDPRLPQAARYVAILRERGATDPSPAFCRLIAAMSAYLDGEDWDEGAVAAALDTIERGASFPDAWSAAAESGPVRKAKVVPAPPQVQLLLSILKR